MRGHDPDLQEVDGSGCVRVELAVHDPLARGHPLHVAVADNPGVTLAVLVAQLPGEDVGQYLHTHL